VKRQGQHTGAAWLPLTNTSAASPRGSFRPAHKFSSVVGEIVADFVERGEWRHNARLFALSRLK
jgi:hypothetical protein